MPSFSDERYAPPSIDWGSYKGPRSWRRLRSWTNTPGFLTLPRADRPINAYHDVTEVKTEEIFTGAGWIDGTTGNTFYLPGYEPGAYFNTFANVNGLARGRYYAMNGDQKASEAILEAKLELAKKIGDMKTNLPVVLAEARKTSKMIEETCERLVNAYRAFRRGNVRLVAELLMLDRRQVHKNWLAYRYGWLPFMSDVRGQAEFLAQKVGLGGRPVSFTCKTRARTLEETQTWQTPYTPYGGYGTTYTTEKCAYKQTLYLKAWVELENPHLAALQQTGVTNPAALAWELIPFSFVVDWFISVGDYCQALTAFTGVVIKKSMLSSLNEISYVSTDPPTQVGSGGYTYFNGLYQKRFEIRDYVRDPTISLEVSLSELQIRNPFPDWKKMISSLALMKAQLRV